VQGSLTMSIRTPSEGGCRCGRVRLRIDAPPIITIACHCTGCQRMSASAFSLGAAIPSDAFTVTRGEPVVGGLHGATRHYFCSYCMSWMFARPEGIDWFVNLRPTMLDEPGWFEPFVETMTIEKLPWAATPAVHSYARFPAFEEWDGLTKEYLRWRATPVPS